MATLLLIAALLATNPVPPNVSDALIEFDQGNYARAASLLDEFARDEPGQYRANNLHYLRGRIAENLGDWTRAEREFNQVGAGQVLYDLAAWHLARVALLDRRTDDARAALGWLRRDFPADLLMELAGLAPDALAREIYESLSTRNARLEVFLLGGETDALWSLLRENQNDDVAVRAARELYDTTLDEENRLFLARVYASHRSFDLAEPMYASLLEDPDLAPEAHFGLGRTFFQLADYETAIQLYRSTILRFPDSEWAEQAARQIAPSYWRMLDFEAAAEAYIDLIESAGDDREQYHESVRDLVDIYRSMDDETSALTWIDRGLANDPPSAMRAVLIFSRAKIEYLAGDFEGALASFREIEGMRLRAVPNGTDPEEVAFFEALSLEGLDREDEARTIWRQLAASPFTYYGIRAAGRLNDPTIPDIVERARTAPSAESCQRPGVGQVSDVVRARRLGVTREWQLESEDSTRIGELVFLHLWDEAYYWTARESSRHTSETLADLALLAGRHRQAIIYADRLRPDLDELFALDPREQSAGVLLEMLYPAAYANLLCPESESTGSDPLWLRSIIWQESRYDPGARSGALARGLMQFIPETALDVGRRAGLPNLDVTRSLYLPEVSIRLGAHYWSSLIDEFGQPEMALAAYNGGPHNVRRWMAKSNSRLPEMFVADIGFIETKDYVRRVFELYARYAFLQ